MIKTLWVIRWPLLIVAALSVPVLGVGGYILGKHMRAQLIQQLTDAGPCLCGLTPEERTSQWQIIDAGIGLGLSVIFLIFAGVVFVVGGLANGDSGY